MRLNEVDSEFDITKYSGPQEKLQGAERRLSVIQKRMERADEIINRFKAHFVNYAYSDKLHPDDYTNGFILTAPLDKAGMRAVYNTKGMSTNEIRHLLQSTNALSELLVHLKKTEQQIQRYKLEAKKATGMYASKTQLEQWQKDVQQKLEQLVISTAGSNYEHYRAGLWTKRNGWTKIAVGFKYKGKIIDNAGAIAWAKLISKLKKTILQFLDTHGFTIHQISFSKGYSDSDDYREGAFVIKIPTDDLIKQRRITK